MSDGAAGSGAQADAGSAAAPRRLRATLIGGTAVLMWATLALLTTLSGTVPPFQLVAMAFTVAVLLTIAIWSVRGSGSAATTGAGSCAPS